MSSTTAASASATESPQPKSIPGLVIDHSLDHESFQANIIACSVITWFAAAVFVVARFFTRRVLLRVWSWEDRLIVLSLVLSAGCSASIIIRELSSPDWE